MKETKSKRRDRGMGTVYQQPGSAFWWIRYWDAHGRRHAESSKSTVKGDAVELLKVRYAEVRGRRYLAADSERVRFADLVERIETDYRVNERKSIVRVRQAVKHLGAAFGKDKAVDITSGRVETYIAARLEKGAKPATVKFELGTLGRMFSLAYRAGLIPSRPPFPSLQVRNTREGFLESDELSRVLKFLPDYLRPFVEFAYLTGWRRGELMALRWKQIDFQASTVRLEPGTTKNDEGRTFPFAAFPRLAALLEEQRQERWRVERERGIAVPWVFHRDGKPVRDYRDAWHTACGKAGIPGRLVHDLRRTAVRNLERAGVPRSVAMKLTGHKTENVYRRYAIVSEADLSEAVAKVAALHGPRSR